LSLIVYAFTLFTSAFLLFLVQPIIGQKILPRLGGTPSVWNTCVVFFQLTLLAGYAYTHFTTKLPVRRQILIHCGLLLVPFLILLPNGPFPVENFRPVSGGNPMFEAFVLLAMIVGIPFFVVSTTAPLLQKWFGHTGHPAAKDPYFLYGASNLGSMLSLLLYPPVFEPLFGLEQQSWFYTVGYFVLVGMVVFCGAMAFQGAPSMVKLPQPKTDTPPESETPPAPQPTPSEAAATDAAAAPMPAAAQTTAPPAPAPAPTAVTSTPPAPKPSKPSPATAIKKGGKKGKHKGKDLAKFGGMAASAPAVASTAVSTAPMPAAAPAPKVTIKTGTGGISHTADDNITWPRRLRWIGLAAVPSSLMLGVTTYMSTDISAIPLFWVLPLALYLLSFILVFMRWPINWLEDAHQIVLYSQPFLLAGLVLLMSMASASYVVVLIVFMLLAFFATALVCHGEMAKDRPSARHLTEFYLLMSVGGAVGGLFNGIIAPLVFTWGIVEFGLALFVAGMLRPKMRDSGWTEMLIANVTSPSEVGGKHGHKPRKIVRTTAETEGLTTVLDFALPLAVLGALAFLLYVVFNPRRQDEFAQNMFFAVIGPAICCACFFARPLRFGLALGAILLITGTFTRSSAVFETRSYFGLLRVQRSAERWGDSTSKAVPYLNLMHGTTNHGMALQKSDDPAIPDLTRVATTYYHRKGPVGICMERFNWFSNTGTIDDPQKAITEEQGFALYNFKSDYRILTSMFGQSGLPVPGNSLPINTLVASWSEPAYAVIGLGTGTMASYGRPYQTVHFYEIDEQIRKLSLPESGEPYFGYLQGALNRKCNVQILMGDARLRMAMPWFPAEEEFQGKKPWEIPFDKRGGPEYFYHLMVVDAFSSDAIPRHLITKEAMAMYFRHLVQGYWAEVPNKDEYRGRFELHETEQKIWIPGGVLCVHTSNRHLKLVPVVRDTSAVVEWDDMRHPNPDGSYPKKKGLVAIRGHDSAPGNQGLHYAVDIGHFTSEWVIVARDLNDLKHLNPPRMYTEWINKANENKRQFSNEAYWQTQSPAGQYIWTDDHSNLMAVFRWPWAHD
jgi:hypothetical protein